MIGQVSARLYNRMVNSGAVFMVAVSLAGVGRVDLPGILHSRTLKENPMIFTAKEFNSALRYAQPGQEVVYHTGLLMRDRQLDKEIDQLARCVWEHFENGEIELYQRRIGNRACDYIAVKVLGKMPVFWSGCYRKDRRGAVSWQTSTKRGGPGRPKGSTTRRQKSLTSSS